MKTHYGIKDNTLCGYEGKNSKYTSDTDKITCHRCDRIAYMQDLKQVIYVVRENGYLNTTTAPGKGAVVLETLNNSQLKAHVN